MNKAQRRIIEAAIGVYEDNRYRYALEESRDPEAVTGNGKKITDIIAEYDRRIAELKEGL